MNIAPKRPGLAVLCAALSLLATPLLAATNIPPARVTKIAALLPAMPSGFGQPISNRAAWSRVATNAALKNLLRDAEKMAAVPDPAMTDDLYLEYSRTGNRDHGQTVNFERSHRLATFTLAECVENKGRFLPPLQKTIEALCAEKSWTYAAHDGNLDVFNGRAMNPDLRATTLAFDLGAADYLLGHSLPAASRQLIREHVRRRVFTPYRDMVEGRLKEIFWLRATHNWNAVCLAGVTGAALALEDSPSDRAWFIAAAEEYIPFFLKSFTPDGYCSEGVGYWNYGFGRFIMLVEATRQATSGREDLFQWPDVAQPALFPYRTEILNGIFPSISDCTPGSMPDAEPVHYVAERFGLAPPATLLAQPGIDPRSLAATAMVLFQQTPLPAVKRSADAHESPLRTWFRDGGVLIARPRSGAAPFAVCLKGGNNNENHNHNDVGSFSVVSGKSMVICDPGGEVYTKRTFGPQRYESKVLNSFGHAVPIVAGQLQRTGAESRAVVLRTDFTDAQDTLAFDLRSAYGVPDLRKLERTFVYARAGGGSLTVCDDVAFDQPETYESALITWGTWKTVAPNEIEITDDAGSVRIRIDTGGVPYDIHDVPIDEDVHTPKKPHHLGLVLKSPVSSLKVVLTVTPTN